MKTFRAILALAAFLNISAFAQTSTRHNKVVVISLDAFPAETLHDSDIPAPTLHRLMSSGAYARSMQPINPTVTWPNHTSMVTGQDASHHHVITNGLIVDQRTSSNPRVNAQASKDQLVAVPTVYDAAHNAGLTTAEVDWVAIMHASSIDFRFPEDPDPNGTIEQELISQGTVTRDQLLNFHRPRQSWRDRIYTAAAIDILRKHHPDLLLLHLLALDGIEHKTGFGTDANYNTIAFLDDRVKEVMDAVAANGDLDRTTFLIVSDHGQESVHHQLNPDVILHSGLPADEAARTTYMPDGGFALVYQQHATAASTDELKDTFLQQPGIFAALTPQEAAQQGWPTPSQNQQAPDLLLYAKDDYAFARNNTGSFVTNIEPSGQHGYPNTNPKMQAIFIASGPTIKPTGELPPIQNLDIAPTIADVLGVKLPNTQGHALSSVLR